MIFPLWAGSKIRYFSLWWRKIGQWWRDLCPKIWGSANRRFIVENSWGLAKKDDFAGSQCPVPCRSFLFGPQMSFGPTCSAGTWFDPCFRHQESFAPWYKGIKVHPQANPFLPLSIGRLFCQMYCSRLCHGYYPAQGKPLINENSSS